MHHLQATVTMLLWMWFLNFCDNVPMDLKYVCQQYFTCMCFLGFIRYNKTFIACGFRKYENVFTLGKYDTRDSGEYIFIFPSPACNKCIISYIQIKIQVFCICIINDCPKPIPFTLYRTPRPRSHTLYRMGVFFEDRAILIVFPKYISFLMKLIKIFHLYKGEC